MKALKIALIGYGKMGKAIDELALERGHTITCRITEDNIIDMNSETFSRRAFASSSTCDLNSSVTRTESRLSCF